MKNHREMTLELKILTYVENTLREKEGLSTKVEIIMEDQIDEMKISWVNSTIISSLCMPKFSVLVDHPHHI